MGLFVLSVYSQFGTASFTRQCSFLGPFFIGLRECRRSPALRSMRWQVSRVQKGVSGIQLTNRVHERARGCGSLLTEWSPLRPGIREKILRNWFVRSRRVASVSGFASAKAHDGGSGASRDRLSRDSSGSSCERAGHEDTGVSGGTRSRFHT